MAIEVKCCSCGGPTKYYDTVWRMVRIKNGQIKWVKIKRFKCLRCGGIHRNLPNYILPYKQYDARIIKGVLNGEITPDTIGFEDFPCEQTMLRWKSQNLQLLY